jgi:broad specificity phosphatase PhoE
VPEFQDKIFPTGLSTSKPTNEKLTPEGESIDDVTARCKEYTQEVNKKFATKTIISVTHRDSVVLIHQTFKYFDYLTKKHEYNPNNAKISIRYRDNDRNTEIDLHKPYVDNYRFKK